MLQVKRIRGSDDNHVKLIQEDNQLPAMSRLIVEMMLAGPGGPPLIAVPDIAEGKAPVGGKAASYIDILRVPLQ